MYKRFGFLDDLLLGYFFEIYVPGMINEFLGFLAGLLLGSFLDHLVVSST